jgi:glycerol-3-phosphate O-acyltransferase
VYVLETNSMADRAVLCNVTAKAGLPYPAFQQSRREERRSYFDVGRRRFWMPRSRRPPPHLLALVEVLRADSVRDVMLVPTAVYWGRARAERRVVAATAVPKTGR